MTKIEIPRSLRPFSIGYHVLNEVGTICALENGATVFDLPDEALSAITKEYRKHDPNFKADTLVVQEVAVMDFDKVKEYFTIEEEGKPMSEHLTYVTGLYLVNETDQPKICSATHKDLPTTLGYKDMCPYCGRMIFVLPKD